MAELAAICARCGGEKDLPLGRCPSCGVLPAGDERVVAVVCSRRVLDVAALRAAQERIRRGEAVRPSEALRAKAREILSGTAPTEARLSPRAFALLVAANVLLTPLLGYALWWRWRTRPGPGARQALLATVPVSVALAIGLAAWRFGGVEITVGG